MALPRAITRRPAPLCSYLLRGYVCRGTATAQVGSPTIHALPCRPVVLTYHRRLPSNLRPIYPQANIRANLHGRSMRRLSNLMLPTAYYQLNLTTACRTLPLKCNHPRLASAAILKPNELANGYYQIMRPPNYS